MSKRPKRTKRTGQRYHAIHRARQRYGMRLDVDAYERLCRQIAKGEDVQVIGDQSLRVRILVVWYQDRPLLTVWDRKRKSIVTFLPPSLMEIS